MSRSFPTTPGPRERNLTVRVTDAERDHVRAQAAQQRRSLSDFVRMHLPLPHEVEESQRGNSASRNIS